MHRTRRLWLLLRSRITAASPIPRNDKNKTVTQTTRLPACGAAFLLVFVKSNPGSGSSNEYLCELLFLVLATWVRPLLRFFLKMGMRLRCGIAQRPGSLHFLNKAPKLL